MSLKFSTLKRIYLGGSEYFDWTNIRYAQGITNCRTSNDTGQYITYTCGRGGNFLLRFWTNYNNLVATIITSAGRRKPLLIYAPLERRTVVFSRVMESLGADPCHEFVLLKNYGHVSPLPEGLLP